MAPYHAHVYFTADTREEAAAFRGRLTGMRELCFVGQLRDGKVGPHPISQFEFHFWHANLDAVMALVKASGFTALVHPLTDDDLADHTSLGVWIGEPLDLDLSTLDPPGRNQGIPRFGKTDF